MDGRGRWRIKLSNPEGKKERRISEPLLTPRYRQDGQEGHESKGHYRTPSETPRILQKTPRLLPKLQELLLKSPKLLLKLQNSFRNTKTRSENPGLLQKNIPCPPKSYTTFRNSCTLLENSPLTSRVNKVKVSVYFLTRIPP